MALAKEQIRQIISQNDISSVADVYSLMKESFKDILQELMEAEMDVTLGYEKIRRVILPQTTNVMDIRPKQLRVNMASFSWTFPETVMGNLNQS